MYSAYILILTTVILCCAHEQGNQKSANRFSDISGKSRLHRLFKRGSLRLRDTFEGFPLKRTGNHINVIPEYPSKPVESDIGNTIMDEFMLFLTLKDNGMLDMCLN